MIETLPILRLGTRGSVLARKQSQLVADELMRLHPGLRVEATIFQTSGDQIANRPLHQVGGKGLFTRELEQALLSGLIDFAVHSYKDMPVTMPLVDQAGLMIAATTKREDPRDVLVSRKAKSLADLPQGARIGTGSFRRRCQLLKIRPDLKVEDIRGNIDTRVRKLRDGEFDAIILALAGLRRAKLFTKTDMTILELEEILPAAGQGALAIQCRKSDTRTSSLLAGLDDPTTRICVDAERLIVAGLHGDCFSPIAVFGEIVGKKLELRAAVGGRGGTLPVISAKSKSDASTPETAVKSLLKSLLEQGVEPLLTESTQ
jgi:hydroxymethylbilane synthase